jgi:hypothetical protein
MFRFEFLAVSFYNYFGSAVWFLSFFSLYAPLWDGLVVSLRKGELCDTNPSLLPHISLSKISISRREPVCLTSIGNDRFGTTGLVFARGSHYGHHSASLPLLIGSPCKNENKVKLASPLTFSSMGSWFCQEFLYDSCFEFFFVGHGGPDWVLTQGGRVVDFSVIIIGKPFHVSYRVRGGFSVACRIHWKRYFLEADDFIRFASELCPQLAGNLTVVSFTTAVIGK